MSEPKRSLGNIDRGGSAPALAAPADCSRHRFPRMLPANIAAVSATAVLERRGA
jgi:hypothetical protein